LILNKAKKRRKIEMNFLKEIEQLKKEKNAIVLAHYYQPAEIQDIADYVGDSYYLSKIAQQSSAEFIVFCGVEFMAESAKILSPDKKVFWGNTDSNCRMVDEFHDEELVELIEKHPDAAVVSYVNSSTKIKTMSYTCCTSSSAITTVENIENKKIIFVPDKNLGSYVAEQCPEKEIILGTGKCCIHDNVTPEEVLELKIKHPDALVLTHPECRKEVRDLSHYIGSTGNILKYAMESDSTSFIIVTEIGISHVLSQKCPEKKFYYPNMICGGMKRTTIEDVYRCLKYENNEIILPEDMIKKAALALDNMIKLGEKR
jgi:quinolinate synthase